MIDAYQPVFPTVRAVYSGDWAALICSSKGSDIDERLGFLKE